MFYVLVELIRVTNVQIRTLFRMEASMRDLLSVGCWCVCMCAYM